jgi:AraC-like DNA-binding protein
MIRFEEVLAEHLGKPLHMTELCELIGVTERTLRSCCAEFLGMSTRYVLLRRLSWARVALRDADPRARPLRACPRLRFAELGRFEAGLPGGLQREPADHPATCSRGAVHQPVKSVISA